MLRLLAVVLIVGCGGQRIAMTEGDAFKDKATLVVELDRSPTGGAHFDFCPSPDLAEPHLGNAAWLAYLAANEYSHFYYLSTLVGQLGFTSQLPWPTCAADMRLMRGFEARYHDALVAASHAKSMKQFLAPHATKWGACAKPWFEQHYDGAQFPAAAFEKWLIQTPHPGETVEFFSGGKFELDGRAFSEGSTQVAFLRHSKLPLVIISFRGTEPTKWADVVTDLKAWKTPLAEGWGSVHSGFKSAFDSIGEVMRTKLAEYKDQNVEIWVTGHSLGGGLATLMAAEILRREEAGEGYKLRGVYTFGSPRVGNRAFRDKLVATAAKHGTQLVRFRNGDDVVTAVPRVAEFEHVGRVAHLREDKLDVGDADPPYNGLGSFADHDIAGFVRPKKAVSGYYRRVLAASKLKPSTCVASTPAPVVVKPPVEAPTKIACDRLIDAARFTTALGEKAPLTIKEVTNPDATAACSLIRGGTKPSAAAQQKLLQTTGRLGVLPGDAVCEVAAYCWTIEDAARFATTCARRGGKLDDTTGGPACVVTVAAGADDRELYRFLDEDSRCVITVQGGPANVDNDQVRACAKTAREAIGKLP